MLYHQPLVSCIIPIYNVQDYLKDCIESCIAQTYKNLEIILVNDGSTDNSLEIAKQYLKYPQVTLIELKKNYGVSIARNCGIDFVLNKEKIIIEVERERGGGHPHIDSIYHNATFYHNATLSKSDFLIFIDNDDLFSSSDCIEIFVQKAIYTGAEIVFGIFSYIDMQSNIIEVGEKHPWFKIKDIINCKDFLSRLKHYYFAFAPGYLIKTDILHNIRFPESIINEDLYFAFECFLNASNVASVDVPTYLYRQRVGSISHPKSFHQHELPLLAKSYLYNANYLLQLLKKYPNESFTHLIDRCLRHNASSAITFCILSNTSKKSDLKILLPYTNSKAKLCFYFPFIFKILRSAKLKLKSIQSYISSKITQ